MNLNSVQLLHPIHFLLKLGEFGVAFVIYLDDRARRKCLQVSRIFVLSDRKSLFIKFYLQYERK